MSLCWALPRASWCALVLGVVQAIRSCRLGAKTKTFWGGNVMRRIAVVVAVVLAPALAAAADKPDWAFPTTEKDLPAPRIDGATLRAAPVGSTLSITRAKADDF